MTRRSAALRKNKTAFRKNSDAFRADLPPSCLISAQELVDGAAVRFATSFGAGIKEIPASKSLQKNKPLKEVLLSYHNFERLSRNLGFFIMDGFFSLSCRYIAGGRRHVPFENSSRYPCSRHFCILCGRPFYSQGISRKRNALKIYSALLFCIK